MVSKFLIPLFLFFTLGCSTAYKNIQRSNYWVQQKDYAKAAEELVTLAYTESDDQLLYLLNLGVVYHLDQKWDESIKAFLKAEQIAQVKDYTSLSRQAGSLILNESVVQYRGDDYEKVLIHVYLALNFLMKKDLDSALVESRRVNEILQKFRDEAKRNYEQNSFAFYLSGLVWEANRDWDDAYISYYDTYKNLKSNNYLKADLVRSSYLARRIETHEKWKKEFNLKYSPAPKNYGKLVVIYQQGKGPVKKPHPNFDRIPKLFPSRSESTKASVAVNDQMKFTEVIFNLEEVAIKSLEEQYTLLIAKRAAGLVGKYIIADKLSKENEALGLLAWVGLNVLDQADLRQWSNLPETFQIAVFDLPEGNHEVEIKALGSNNVILGEKEKIQVKIQRGKSHFINWRSFD